MSDQAVGKKRADRRAGGGWAHLVSGIGLLLLLVGVVVTASMTYEMLRGAGLGPGSALAALVFYDVSLLYWLTALVFVSTTWGLVAVSGSGLGFSFLLIVLVTGLRIGGISLTALGGRTVGIVLEGGIVVNLALHIAFVLAQPGIWRRIKRNQEAAKLFKAALDDFQAGDRFEERKDVLQDALADGFMSELEEEARLNAFFRGRGGES